jgi:hypothetical protein
MALFGKKADSGKQKPSEKRAENSQPTPLKRPYETPSGRTGGEAPYKFDPEFPYRGKAYKAED